MFIRLGLLADPRRVEATGISRRIVRSLGINAPDLDADERRIREALRQELFREISPFSEEDRPHVLPGAGPHPDVPAGIQLKVLIPADKLHEVGKKIVRGCEFWFGAGRVVESPYEVEIFFVHQADVPDVIRVFSSYNAEHLGPGFRVRRGYAHDDLLTAIYEVIIWNTLPFYGVIIPPDQLPSI